MTEMHIGVQEMYYNGAIKFMSSCLVEILNTSIGRFAQIGICEIQAYQSQQGGTVIYIQPLPKSKPLLEKYLAILTDLSSAGEKGMPAVEKECFNIFKRLQGPMARL